MHTYIKYITIIKELFHKTLEFIYIWEFYNI